MQFQFETQTEASYAVPKPTPPAVPPQTSLPNDVQRYGRVWEITFAAFSEYRHKLQRLAEAEDAAITDSWDKLIEVPEFNQLKGLQEHIERELRRKAETSFTVPGSKLTIPDDSFVTLPSGQTETFNPGGLWRYLTEKYDSDNGKTESYTNASRNLCAADELNPYDHRRTQEQRTVKSVGGRHMLTLATYGDWKHSYKTHERIKDFFQALKCVSIWSGIWTEDQEAGHHQLINSIQESRTCPDPPGIGRLDCWPPATLIGYKEKIEVRLTRALAEQVQVFLASYPTKQ